MNVCKVASRIRLPSGDDRYTPCITMLRQRSCPATAMQLSRYGNVVVLLRQYGFCWTAIKKNSINAQALMLFFYY